MALITYDDKVFLNENPSVPDVNKVKDTDMNQIKTGVNTNETNITTLQTTLTNATTYSTTETVIGTWLGKPLYRKVIVYSSALPSGRTEIAHNISNLDIITDYKVSYYTTNNSVRKDQYSASNYYIYVNNITNTNIILEVGSNYAGSFTKTRAILEYTKTTD